MTPKSRWIWRSTFSGNWLSAKRIVWDWVTSLLMPATTNPKSRPASNELVSLRFNAKSPYLKLNCNLCHLLGGEMCPSSCLRPLNNSLLKAGTATSPALNVVSIETERCHHKQHHQYFLYSLLFGFNSSRKKPENNPSIRNLVSQIMLGLNVYIHSISISKVRIRRRKMRLLCVHVTSILCLPFIVIGSEWRFLFFWVNVYVTSERITI